MAVLLIAIAAVVVAGLRATPDEIIAALDTYTEISPSGTGVKMIMRGTLPPKHRRIGDIEMYCAGRFFTITGRDFWRCAA